MCVYVQGAIGRFSDEVDTGGRERYFYLDQLGGWIHSLKQAKMKEAHVWKECRKCSLEILSLKYLTNIQVNMQVDTGVWRSERRSGLEGKNLELLVCWQDLGANGSILNA